MSVSVNVNFSSVIKHKYCNEQVISGFSCFPLFAFSLAQYFVSESILFHWCSTVTVKSNDILCHRRINQHLRELRPWIKTAWTALLLSLYFKNIVHWIIENVYVVYSSHYHSIWDVRNVRVTCRLRSCTGLIRCNKEE